GKIATYQAITPTTWNASPRDTCAVPGHFEQSLVGLPAGEDGRPIRALVLGSHRATGSTQRSPHAAGRRGWCAPGSAVTDERLLRAHGAELVYLRIGQDGPGFSAGLPAVGPVRPEGKKAVDLLLAVGGAAGQAEPHAVLDHVAIGDWHKHLPAGTF